MKHKYLHFVLAAVVALLATAIQAATVSESVARGHALRELNRKAAGKFMAPVSDVSLAHAEVSKADAARVDGLRERCLVDDAAAPHVDDEGGGLHQR